MRVGSKKTRKDDERKRGWPVRGNGEVRKRGDHRGECERERSDW